MAAIRYAFFCEDLRAEEGGKTTAIGLWGSECLVPAFPAVMRSLAFHAHIANPDGASVPLLIRVDGPFVSPMRPPEARHQLPASPVKTTNNLNMVFGPVVLARPGNVTVTLRLEVDPPVEETFTLAIISRPAPPPVSAAG